MRSGEEEVPLFEFKCRGCGRGFEELVRNGDELKAVKCPHCSSTDVEKLFSLFGFNCGSGMTSASGAGSACSTCTSRSCHTCG